jgi:hypothetical protein
MNHKIKEYGEVTIYFDEKEERFKAQNKDGDIIAYSKSLKTLEENLDKERKRKFKRISAYKLEGWGKQIYSKGEITSYNPENKEAWFVSSQGGREKFSASYSIENPNDGVNLYKDSPENLAKLQKLIEIEKQIQDLQSQKSKVRESLVNFTCAELSVLIEESKDK